MSLQTSFTIQMKHKCENAGQIVHEHMYIQGCSVLCSPPGSPSQTNPWHPSAFRSLCMQEAHKSGSSLGPWIFFRSLLMLILVCPFSVLKLSDLTSALQEERPYLSMYQKCAPYAGKMSSCPINQDSCSQFTQNSRTIVHKNA